MLQLVPGIILFLQVTPDTALLDRISRLAASEPVEYGIDTRLKLAEALKAKDPETATQQLRDAAAALSGVQDPHVRNLWRVRLVQALAPLAFDEAERLTKSIAPDREDDYLAQAYDVLYTAGPPKRGPMFVQEGLAAGAFRLKCAAQLLAEFKHGAPDAALALFGMISNAFPDEPSQRDVEYLQERTKEMEMFDSDVVKAAAKKIRAATKAPAEEKKKDGGEAAPDVSKLPPAEAIGLLSKLKDFSARVGALISLSRREDLSQQQRSRFASEALSVLDKMKIGEDRLIGLSMLSRDFVKRQEYSSAALAAQMLSETYTKACECGGATCKPEDETFDCVGLMNDFAEYLHELNISQESMGLQNISLEARLLILGLPGGTSVK